MMVIIKARPGTIAPPEKRVGIDLSASVTSQTVVPESPETETVMGHIPAYWGSASGPPDCLPAGQSTWL